MNDKERLQKIKEKIENKHIFYGEINYSGAGKMNFKIIDNARTDVEWLIKQAEKAQQYKKMIDSLLKVKEAINLIFEVKEKNIKEMMEE